MAKRPEEEFDSLLTENAAIAAEFDGDIFIPDSFDSTQADLSDRQALRRVAGLSTELSDISEGNIASCDWRRLFLLVSGPMEARSKQIIR